MWFGLRLKSALALAGVVVAAGPAWAEPEPPEQPSSLLPGKADQDFWTWLDQPFGKQVSIVLERARHNLQTASDHLATPYDAYTGAYRPDHAGRRAALLRDAAAMLRYAQRLVPDDLRVARELAVVTDRAEDPDSVRALERYLAMAPALTVEPALRVRLGHWYARQGRHDDAVVQLRLALGSRKQDVPSHADAGLLLAGVLMHTGRLAEAIDLLGNTDEASARYSSHSHVLTLALAVAYDRDEQLTMAHDVLKQLTQSGPDNLERALRDSFGQPVPMYPLCDRHYFAALQYEALGHLIEARAEWQAYARWPDVPYRQRAQAHIEALDKLIADSRRKPRPAVTPVAVPGNPWMIP